MLVLSRKSGEEIYIGEGPDRIRLQVIDMGYGRVRLGFDAPREVLILRGELEPLDSLPPDGETLRKVAKSLDGSDWQGLG